MRDLEAFADLARPLGTPEEMLQGVERDLEAHISDAARDGIIDYEVRAAELRKLVRGSVMQTMRARQNVRSAA
jgi:hypothetical protein